MSTRVRAPGAAVLFLWLLQPGSGLGLGSRHSNPQAKAGVKRPCSHHVLTQLGMNDCAAQEFRQADDKLNKVYHEVLARYSKSPDKVARIEKAQAAWTVFRDADVNALYPKGDTDDFGEFVYIFRFNLLKDLTQQRTKELLSLLTYTEGGCTQKPPAGD